MQDGIQEAVAIGYQRVNGDVVEGFGCLLLWTQLAEQRRHALCHRRLDRGSWIRFFLCRSSRLWYRCYQKNSGKTINPLLQQLNATEDDSFGWNAPYPDEVPPFPVCWEPNAVANPHTFASDQFSLHHVDGHELTNLDAATSRDTDAPDAIPDAAFQIMDWNKSVANTWAPTIAAGAKRKKANDSAAATDNDAVPAPFYQYRNKHRFDCATESSEWITLEPYSRGEHGSFRVIEAKPRTCFVLFLAPTMIWIVSSVFGRVSTFDSSRNHKCLLINYGSQIPLVQLRSCNYYLLLLLICF
jgi:hypothetical protein